MIYWILMIFVSCVRIIPRTIALRIAYVLGAFVCRIAGGRRHIVKNNLRAIGNFTERELSILSRHVFQKFFVCFTDFCRFTNLDRKTLDTFLTDDIAYGMKRVHDQGKGLIVLTAHLGHWELGAVILLLAGMKTHVVYHQYDNPFLTGFFNSIRHQGLLWMNAEGALRKSLKILKKKEVLATAVDINYFKGGMRVPFLGTLKTFPTGPAMLSVHTGSPILCAFALLNNDRMTYKTIVSEPIIPNSSVSIDSEIKRITEIIVKNIEDNIKKYPDQWFVFENFKD